MGYTPLGHKPIADPSGTFCTAEGCNRLLGIKNPLEHRRGSRLEAAVRQAPKVLTPTPPPSVVAVDPIHYLTQRLENQQRQIQNLQGDVALLMGDRVAQMRGPTWRDNKPDRDGQTRQS